MIFLISLLIAQLLIPIFIYSIPSISKKNKSNLILIISFVLLFILSAFRHYEVGTDTKNYYNFFSRLDHWEYPNTHFEIGYVTFNNIVKLVFAQPQAILVFTSLFNLSFLFIFLKRESEVLWLAIFLLVSSRVYFGTLNVIRQYMAFGILTLSYYSFSKNKTTLFILLVLLASTFHYSALFFLVIYLTKYFKINKKTLSFTVILSIIILLIPNELLFKIPYYSKYFGTYHDNSGRPAAIIETIIALFILMFGLNYNKSKGYQTLDKIALIAFLVSILGIKSSVAGRIYTYFFPFLIIYITNTISNIKNRDEKVISIFIIVILFSSYYFSVSYFRPEWNRIIPYRMFQII